MKVFCVREREVIKSSDLLKVNPLWTFDCNKILQFLIEKNV